MLVRQIIALLNKTLKRDFLQNVSLQMILFLEKRSFRNIKLIQIKKPGGLFRVFPLSANKTNLQLAVCMKTITIEMGNPVTEA